MNNLTELSTAKAIVRRALAAGYAVSVFDGEEYPVKRSTDRDAIYAALQATDEETLNIWQGNNRLGSIMLVWGNAPDGSELAADYTDTPEIRALVGDAD